MDPVKDRIAEAAWETAVEVVELLRWDREEQMAEAVVAIAVVVEGRLRRLLAACCKPYADPGRN